MTWTIAALGWIAAALLLAPALGTLIHRHQGWTCRRCKRHNKSEDRLCRECGALALPDEARRGRTAHHAAGARTR